MSMTTPDRAAGADKPVITVIEPDAIAPLDRLGQWLFAAGARLETVRLWKGEPLPAAEALGDGLVILGGAMSAHDAAAHPWLPGLRELIRHAVDTDLPALAVCLGAQVAAEALGGRTWVATDPAAWDAPVLTGSVAGVAGLQGGGESVAVPGDDGTGDALDAPVPAVVAGAGQPSEPAEPGAPAVPGEHGVARLHLTSAGAADPTFSLVWDQAVRAAVRAGIPTQDGTVLPVLVSHDDAVAALPAGAQLLASTPACPIHTWRAGRLIATQHHPEATPARMAQWAEQDARDAGVGPAEATAAATQARREAEAIDGVVQTFGQALAGELVRAARGRAATR